jgi:hypothetical protein
MSEPIVLFVRRGAERRFEALKRKTSQLDVQVVWDRRERARRAASTDITPNRRKSDRRQPASATWQIADFSVAVPSSDKE